MTAAKTPHRAIIAPLNLTVPDEMISGSETCNVAEGQIRQKENIVNSPKKKGIRNTMKTNIKYFMDDAHAGNENFLPGIL